MKSTSKWWYARITVGGKLRRFPLMEQRSDGLTRIEIKGRRPASLRDLHTPKNCDPQFLASHQRALAAHDRLLHEQLDQKNVEDFTQRLLEAKTGSRLDFVKVADLPEAWAAMPRKRQPGEQHSGTVRNKLGRFAEFIRGRFPHVEDLASVQAEHVRAFLDTEDRKGVAPRTWNISLKLLKGVFRRLAPSSDAYRGFLKDASERDEETVHRQPFTDEEIEAILIAAREDSVLRGPIATGICTAMRRGDCCLLQWPAVDLDAGFIAIETSKTGETAEIPLLPALREELEAARSRRAPGPFVWPEAAAQYRDAPQKIDKGLRRILVQAGFAGNGVTAKNEGAGDPLPVLPVEELRQRGLKAIAGARLQDRKKNRMGAAFVAYLDGKNLSQIEAEFSIPKSTGSEYLKEIEGMIGAEIVHHQEPVPRPKPRDSGNSEANGKRLKRASVHGWHSFRVAFVTRALAAGMPEELVRRVTGHTAVEVVRRHYFRPGREEFRREFEKAMPQWLLNGAKSREEQLRETLRGMTSETWEKDAARALALLDGKE